MSKSSAKPDHSQVSQAFPSAEHDHASCITDALDRADHLCRARGLRLTPLRRRVLELVWSSHKPIGAYAILDQLDRGDGPAAPPTVYRSLDFLVANGLVHRIDSLNAFVGCNHPQSDHAAYFLICQGCGDVAELSDDNLRQSLTMAASAMGFQPKGETVEITGLCRRCHNAEDTKELTP